MEEVFSIYRGMDDLALKLSYQLSSKTKGGDKPVQISWNGFGVKGSIFVLNKGLYLFNLKC